MFCLHQIFKYPHLFKAAKSVTSKRVYLINDETSFIHASSFPVNVLLSYDLSSV